MVIGASKSIDIDSVPEGIVFDTLHANRSVEVFTSFFGPTELENSVRSFLGYGGDSSQNFENEEASRPRTRPGCEL
jgi:hypothetical protein